MSVNEIIGCVTMIVAIIGLVFSCYQWWKKVQSERAEKLSNLINVLRRDARQLSVLYKIDYNEHWYDKSFHKSKLEGEMDQFLSYYEYILYLKKNHIITTKEFLFFKYDITSIVSNDDVQLYFFYLYHYAKQKKDQRENLKTFAYKNILKYGKENGYIDKSFDDEESDIYLHRLKSVWNC